MRSAVKAGLRLRTAQAVVILIALMAHGAAHFADAQEGAEEDAPADEPERGDIRGPSYSVDCSAPCIQFEGDFEIEDDWTNYGSPKSTRSNDFYPSIDIDIKVRPRDWLIFSGHVVTESVLDLEPGENRFFDDIGTYAEELNIQVPHGNLEFIAGKFHPAFGLAWEIPPGLQATEIAGSYELSERIGAGAAFRFSVFDMEHHAQAGAFTVDRTILGESLFTHRGRVTLADGGAGNTDGTSSLALALDGCSGAIPKDCIESGDWGYHTAFRYQEAGATQFDDEDVAIPKGDEKGIVAALFKSFDLADDSRLTLFGEAAYLANFEATRDEAAFFTATGILKQARFTYSLTYSHETRWIVGDADISANLVDAFIDYEFDDRFSIAGETWKLGPGYTFLRDGGEDTHWIGVHLEAEISKIWPANGGQDD